MATLVLKTQNMWELFPSFAQNLIPPLSFMSAPSPVNNQKGKLLEFTLAIFTNNFMSTLSNHPFMATLVMGRSMNSLQRNMVN